MSERTPSRLKDNPAKILAVGSLSICWLFITAHLTLSLAQPSTMLEPMRLLNAPDARPLTSTNLIYLPMIWRAPSGLVIDPQDRAASLAFYQAYYLGSENTTAGWTGNYSSCSPGTTDQAFRDSIQLRLNYFRAMAGVPAAVKLDASYNITAQAAALLMSVNGQLSHSPPTNWTCYSALAAEGAGSSDLALGAYGPSAIALYMLDPGGGNYAAGHRRWILYPQTQQMGSGDVPGNAGHWSSNALRVFDSHMWEARPATREAYVAWPPPGYVPYPVVYGRWSFAYANANFSGAQVQMTQGGASVPVAVSPVVNGYGENTLVWIPNNLSDGSIWPRPAGDMTYTVQINNVLISGQSRSFAYQVTIFDPAAGQYLPSPPTVQALLGEPPRAVIR